MVFVCAGGNPATFDDRATFAWLRRLARQGVTIGGISGGPYVLAKAGLLDGRRATLHWEHAAAFHEAFPDVDVVPVAVRPRRRPHHLLGRRLGARHDGRADRPRPRPRARGGGRRLVPAHPYPRGHGAAADGPPPPSRHQRRGPARRAPRHGGEPRVAEAARRRSPASPASRSASSNGCSATNSGAASTPITFRFASTVRASCCARRRCPVLDVAIATGFGSASQFARAFARAYGAPPSGYRRAT